MLIAEVRGRPDFNMLVVADTHIGHSPVLPSLSKSLTLLDCLSIPAGRERAAGAGGGLGN